MKTSKINFKRIHNDINGNPRYVCHFLHLLSENEKKQGLSIEQEYKMALSKANQIGGRKFHNKQFGGGIVFQSYNIEDLKKRILDLTT